jgi:hypothetical protein
MSSVSQLRLLPLTKPTLHNSSRFASKAPWHSHCSSTLQSRPPCLFLLQKPPEVLRPSFYDYAPLLPHAPAPDLHSPPLCPPNLGIPTLFPRSGWPPHLPRRMLLSLSPLSLPLLHLQVESTSGVAGSTRRTRRTPLRTPLPPLLSQVTPPTPRQPPPVLNGGMNIMTP